MSEISLPDLWPSKRKPLVNSGTTSGQRPCAFIADADQVSVSDL